MAAGDAQRFFPTTLRRKLTFAFVLVGLMAAVCGIIGLWFVDRIGKSVSLYSEVTSPLLVEAMALTENTRRICLEFFRAISNGDKVGQLPAKLKDMHASNRAHLDAICPPGTKAQIKVDLDDAAMRDGEFIETLGEMLVAHNREQASGAIPRKTVLRPSRQACAISRKSWTSWPIELTAQSRESKTRPGCTFRPGETTVDALGKVLSDLLTETLPNTSVGEQAAAFRRRDRRRGQGAAYGDRRGRAQCGRKPGRSEPSR